MFGYSAISPTLLIAIAVAAMGTITVITISLVSKRHQQKYIAIGEINAVADIMRQLGQAATLIPGREVAYLDVAGRMITDSIEGAHEAIVVRQNKGGAPTTSTQEKIDIKAFCQIAPRLAEEKVTWLEKKDIRSLGITWRHALVLCLSDADERRYFVIPSMGMPRKKLDAILALLQTTMEANYALRTHARDVLVARVINDRLNTQFITFWKVLSGLIHNIKGTFAPISTRIKMTVDLLDASTPFTADKLENVIRQSAVPIPTLNQMLDLIGQKMRAFIDRPDIIKENVEAHNLQSLFAHCFTNWLEREVELSKLSLSVDIPEHLYVLVEETSFFQCVWNVLRNAFRYTKEGSITVTANKGQDGLIYLHVRDTGIGMSHEQLEQIGHFGYRALEDGYQKGEGVGIWFSRRMLKVMGGNMDIESQLGKGSEFSLGFRPAQTEAP